jgi:hypothetical protein
VAEELRNILPLGFLGNTSIPNQISITKLSFDNLSYQEQS